MSQRSQTFMGFGIRIDILGQGALFAFRQLSASAIVLIGVISELGRVWWEFEKAMADVTRLVAISQGTLEGLGETMDYLRGEVLKMSSDSVFGVQELSTSLSFLMRAGYDAAEAVVELEQAMSLAMAVGMELGDSVRMIVRLTNMWARAGRPIVNLNNAIAQSEQMFAMEAEEMMTALNMAGAVAAEAGLSFGQTAAMLGVLVNAGISASSAGTILRRALSALLDVTAGAREAMIGMGIDMGVMDAAMPLERLKLIAEYIIAIQDPAQRLQVAFEIFGIRGVNILPVLESMTTDFDDLSTAIDRATEAAEIGEAAFRDTLYASLTQARNAVVAFGISIGEWVTDSAVNFAISAGVVAVLLLLLAARWKKLSLNVMISNTLHLKHIGTFIKSIAVKIKDILVSLFQAETYKKVARAIFGSALATYDYIKGMILGLYHKIVDIVTNFSLAASWQFLKGAIKGASKAVRGFFSALGPIALILLLVGGLVMYLIENMGGMKNMFAQFKPVLDTFKKVFAIVVDIFKQLFIAVMPIIDAVLKPLFMILKLLIPIFMFIGKIIEAVAKILAGVIMVIVNIITQIFKFLEASGIMEIFFMVFSKVIGWIFKYMVFIFNIIIAIVNAIIWFINKFLPEEKEIEYIAKIKIEEEDLTGTEPEETGGEPPDDTGTEPTEPGSPITPTTDEDTTTERTGGGTRGGGGGTGGGVVINITILATMDELMDTEGFGERVATLIAQEMIRQRGAYPT